MLKNLLIWVSRFLQLEEEVSTLKGRLDDLRRAKNTTITKREREIVEVGFPKRFLFF